MFHLADSPQGPRVSRLLSTPWAQGSQTLLLIRPCSGTACKGTQYAVWPGTQYTIHSTAWHSTVRHDTVRRGTAQQDVHKEVCGRADKEVGIEAIEQAAVAWEQRTGVLLRGARKTSGRSTRRSDRGRVSRERRRTFTPAERLSRETVRSPINAITAHMRPYTQPRKSGFGQRIRLAPQAHTAIEPTQPPMRPSHVLRGLTGMSCVLPNFLPAKYANTAHTQGHTGRKRGSRGLLAPPPLF